MYHLDLISLGVRLYIIVQMISYLIYKLNYR